MQNAAEVAEALEELAALLALSGEARFRIGAYEHAARLARELGSGLGPLVEEDRLRELQGIGPTLSRQLQELWNTGSSEYLQRLRDQLPRGAAELARVEGMTLRRIRLLHAALGISSSAELQQACELGRVRKVKGFGEKTERALLAACARLRPERAPGRALLLPEARALGELLEQELRQVAPGTTLAGTLRRGHELHSQLDLVVPERHLPAALARLAGLRRVLRVEPDALLAQLTDGIPLRLHAAREDDFGGALLRATGSGAHVARVQELAAARGGALRPAASEAELYGQLGAAFVPPELREDGSELDQALSGGFSELIELRDIQGLVHCHSRYSDGKNSVLELAQAAAELGVRYLTITDHSPSAHYARGISPDRIQEQWQEIAAAQRAVPSVRLLRGLEADILSDGQLDVPEELLAGLDLVIASIHARHRLDRRQMTERLVRALSLPVFKIWGHPLGRILRHREPIDCDLPRVLDALAASRGAIEINADAHRLDLPPAWLPAARARNIPFVISVDAHSVRGFQVLPDGVLMARRGGVRRQEVLNARSAEEFCRLVKPV